MALQFVLVAEIDIEQLGNEMSMVGRKMIGQVDHCLRQAFPHYADQVLGGRSCLMDFIGVKRSQQQKDGPVVFAV